ncbi:MAG: serine/threonine-protein kinase [Proteobacteria bacterium]|nr:serine/threonine-protein kinase [Pseudomonadota bacterium]
MSIPAGTLVPRDARDFGAYSLIAKLATGGMAEIFLARAPGAPQDLLVLKRILPHLAEDEHFVTMFRDEADLASQLVHKNICHVMSFGEFAGTWFIAMEYLHGVPLSRMMTRLSKAQKMLDVRLVAGIIVQACEGLHAAHEAKGPDGQSLNVVHRDVSPPNMMVTADGTVKLLDFGIAKARGANSRTRTGTVKGKNAYMSPEQILGKPLDRRSDIFALAVVMYEMLAIRRLFHRDSDFLTFKAITEEPIPEIRDRRPDLPPGMRAALLQAMARDPNGRFDTAQAFGNAIRASVATLGGVATPAELGKLLAQDFADEMSQRDEILKAADDPNVLASSAPAQMMGPMGTAPRRAPPPVPRAAASGEMNGPRAHSKTGRVELAAPSMMVTEESSRVVMGNTPTPLPGMVTPTSPIPKIPPTPSNANPMMAPAGVLDLSSAVLVDTWMASPDTNILRAGRLQSLKNLVIGGVLVTLAVIGIVVLTAKGARDDEEAAIAQSRDAGVSNATGPVDAASQIDAPKSYDEIVALSKYGFFSITANAKTAIFLDGTQIGWTPMTRVPIVPGIHKVKAVGPKGKKKEMEISIFAAKDTDEGMITW